MAHISREEIEVRLRDINKTESELRKLQHRLEGVERSTRQHGHASRRASGHVSGLTRSFHGMRNVLGYGGAALGVGGLAFGLQNMLNTTSSFAQETEKFHAISGMGAQSSMQYVAALKARGIGAEAAGKAFKFLSKNIYQAERQEYTYQLGRSKAAAKGKVYTGLLGAQATVLRNMGINLQSFGKLSEEEKFRLITERFENMKDGMEKTRAATYLFGKGGAALLPVLEKNNLSINNQMRLVKKFFPTLSGEGVRSLEQLREKQAEGRMAFEGLEFTIGLKLVPVITELIAKFSETVREIERGEGAWSTLAEIISHVVGAIRSVVRWFERTTGASHVLEAVLATLAAAWAAQKVLNFIADLRKATLIQGLFMAATKVATAAQWLFNAALAANPIGIVIVAVVALIGVFVLLYTHCKGFREAIQAVAQWIATRWQSVVGFLAGPVGAAAGFIVKHFNKIKSVAETVFGAIGSFVADVFQGVVRGVTDAINLIIHVINWIIKAYNAIPGILRPTGKIGEIGLLNVEPTGVARRPAAGRERAKEAGRSAGVTGIGPTLPRYGEVVHHQPIHASFDLVLDRQKIGRGFSEAITEYTLKRQARR